MIDLQALTINTKEISKNISIDDAFDLFNELRRNRDTAKKLIAAIKQTIKLAAISISEKDELQIAINLNKSVLAKIDNKMNDLRKLILERNN